MDTKEIIEAINALEPITRTQLIFSVISLMLGSSVINGIVTHILYSRKLKKDQIARTQGMLWNKIIEALECVRNIELEAKTIEIYKIEQLLESNGYIDIFGGEATYPAIMENHETFYQFFDKINDSRKEWGKYLDPCVVSYLYYMQMYSTQLMDYLKKNNVTNYPLAGAAFIFDISEWQEAFEKLLVKRINKQKHKLYVEDGIRWKISKKIIKRKLWKKSILYGLEKNTNDFRVEIAKAIIYGFKSDKEAADLMNKMAKEYKKISLKNMERNFHIWLDK